MSSDTVNRMLQIGRDDAVSSSPRHSFICDRKSSPFASKMCTCWCYHFSQSQSWFPGLRPWSNLPTRWSWISCYFLIDVSGDSNPKEFHSVASTSRIRCGHRGLHIRCKQFHECSNSHLILVLKKFRVHFDVVFLKPLRYGWQSWVSWMTETASVQPNALTICQESRRQTLKVIDSSLQSAVQVSPAITSS